jgi:hypothetical protein
MTFHPRPAGATNPKAKPLIDEQDQQIEAILKDISDLFLVPSAIKAIRYVGNFRPHMFPLYGMLNINSHVHQVKPIHE